MSIVEARVFTDSSDVARSNAKYNKFDEKYLHSKSVEHLSLLKEKLGSDIKIELGLAFMFTTLGVTSLGYAVGAPTMLQSTPQLGLAVQAVTSAMAVGSAYFLARTFFAAVNNDTNRDDVKKILTKKAVNPTLAAKM